MNRIRVNALPTLSIRLNSQLLFAFRRVIASGQFLKGEENNALARHLRALLGSGYVTPVGSGHDALVLALRALGVTPKDEVIVPAMAYPTAFAVWQSGATIVPVDVDQNGQLDARKLRRAITRRTKAVVAVHLFGHIGDMHEIRAITNKRRIALIEDCAQAFGSRFAGKMAGTLGDTGCFSFYPTKTLGAPGDGGAVWTKNKRLDTFIKQAASYGEDTRYHSLFPSFHSRLPELQAAALLVSMEYVGAWQKKRKHLFSLYQKELPPSVRILSGHPDSDPVPLELAIDTPGRDRLAAYLNRRGIETVVHYPAPFPFVPAFRSLGYKRGAFPRAEKLSRRILSLPLHHMMTPQDVRDVTRAVCAFFGV